MKTLITLSLCFLLLAGLALAASIDGKWVSERKMERDGQSMTITQTFNLKSDGKKLTGDVSMAFGDQEPRKSEIKKGKVDGDKFSFSTTTTGQKGEMTTNYEGKVEGDMLKGTATREGGQGQARPFEAKRK